MNAVSVARVRIAISATFLAIGATPAAVFGQTISQQQLEFLTAEWKGERFADGRPKVPDSIMARMKKVSTEEAWETLRTHGYTNQFEGGWQMVHDDVPV